ncbi:hypothetical protein C1A40_13535 [Tamlana carrageenivorans]|uniref:Uncharacterized protein n=2 Tax=Pseudotamlana carrageenivorans TaxID=2069432 RepID=A0A2I7SKI2_9FLAO|nr:hypothetical protein C1A40_13535 [Tamlana carrageenivorans]
MMLLSTNPPDFVLEYHEALTKEKELQFIEKYENDSDVDIQAYVISFKMKQAKYELLPWNKVKVFNRYKNRLDKLIAIYGNNIHLRYVRLVIQENVPSFLNYNSDIEKDKAFLIKMMNHKDKVDYMDAYIVKNTSI